MFTCHTFLVVSSELRSIDDLNSVNGSAQDHKCKILFCFETNILPLAYLNIISSCCRYCNSVDKDALLYLILANEILHALHPNIVTIAEDVSDRGFSLFSLLMG